MIRRQEMNSVVLTERLSYLADQIGKVILLKNLLVVGLSSILWLGKGSRIFFTLIAV